MLSTTKEPSTDTIDLDEIRALVRRITRSSSFSKSERLSTLLTHICDLALQGKVKELSEQKIGVAVFGRPPDYDSSVDGIVRTQASRLRKHLDLYFKDEGAEEPLAIVIPRGGYVPYFEPRLPVRPRPVSDPPSERVVSPASQSLLISTDPAPLKSHRVRWGLPLAMTAIIILAIVFIARNRWLGVAASANEGTQHLWSQLFEHGQSTIVVYGDSGLVMWHGSNDRQLGLTEYMQGKYRSDSGGGASSKLLSPSDLSNRRYTSVVDMEIVHALDRIATKEDSAVEIRFARDVHPNDFKHGNVVLLGASEANPWTGMFEPHMNFVFTYDRDHQIMSVMNRSPRTGEPLRWDSAKQDRDHKVFGVIAFLPNIDGSGSALLLEGTSMAGTESTWDFISDENQFRELLQKMGVDKAHVPHFEAVIGTNNFDGSAAKTTVLAWRTLD